MEFVKLSEHQDKPLIRWLQLCNCQSQSRHRNNQGKIFQRSKNICLSLLYQTHVILWCMYVSPPGVMIPLYLIPTVWDNSVITLTEGRALDFSLELSGSGARRGADLANRPLQPCQNIFNANTNIFIFSHCLAVLPTLLCLEYFHFCVCGEMMWCDDTKMILVLLFPPSYNIPDELWTELWSGEYLLWCFHLGSFLYLF